MPDQHIKIAERVSTRLKLKQLQLLVAIAEKRSILRASEELNMSQPAATKLLKDLEIDFDVQLFDRNNRGVEPTEFGKVLVRHGKLILSQISHAAQELDDLNDGLGGRVVVGTLLAASARLLPATIAAVHATRPNVTIAVREGTNDILMPMLMTGDVDMVVGRLPEFRHRAEVVQETLYIDEVVVAARAGHPLAAKGKIGFRELGKQAWILPPAPTTLRRQIEKEFHDRGIQPPGNAIESISFLTNRQLLMTTDMVCMLPRHVVEAEMASGSLEIIDCDLTLPAGPVGVSYRSREALTPAATAFLDALREQGEQMVGA